MLPKQREHLWMTCPDLLLTDQPYPGVGAGEDKISRARLRPLPARDIRDWHDGVQGQAFRYRSAERVSTSGASRGPRPAVAARSVSAPLPAALSAAAARAVDARTSPAAGLGGGVGLIPADGCCRVLPVPGPLSPMPRSRRRGLPRSPPASAATPPVGLLSAGPGSAGVTTCSANHGAGE
jgi:hypothetical protein